MSSSRFTPSVHQPATVQEIQKISDDLRYHCSPDEVQDATGEINNLLGALTILDNLCEPVPEVKYPRTPGYRPKPEDRYGNSWTWRCDVTGAPSGKLSGKTFAIKDNTAVAGVPMSNGSRLLEGYIPEYDATVVTRILDAGGRILGKSSCDDFCLSSMGFSSVQGYIYNPAYPEYRVGGSSGGSAVLVAGGQVDMALGSDQGGSVRIPAAWTGTVGLKPTMGLVPYTGAMSMDPTLDHLGPITKNVADCALLLEVIAGSDGLDGRQRTVVEVPQYSQLLESLLPGKVLGVLKEGFQNCSPATQTFVQNFLTTVGRAGLTTIGVSVPLHTHAHALLSVVIVQGSQAMLQTGGSGHFLQGFYLTSLEKSLRQGLQCSAAMMGTEVKVATLKGAFLKERYGNHYYCQARNQVRELDRQYEEALERCDVIVMPTLPRTAPMFLRQRGSERESLSAYLDERCGQNTAPTNLTGHPALSLPLGKLGDGRTDSLMIVGRKFDELTVLQVARALEKIVQARHLKF